MAKWKNSLYSRKTKICDENVDIKAYTYDAFPEQPLSGTLKANIFESQMVARKQKGQNGRAKTAEGQPCLREEYLSYFSVKLHIPINC
jgi:hypothetical protein